jgi:Icc-related predicted phosphoesterase
MRRLDVREFNFVGYQNTPRFAGGPNERSEEGMEMELAEIERLIDPKTILVTHGPTRGTLDGGHGSTALVDLLQRRPFHVHIHGHIRESFGRSGKHFNAAAGTERRAILIDLSDRSYELVNGSAEPSVVP